MSSESAPKVVHERRRVVYLGFVHAELLDDNLLDLLLNGHESSKLVDSSDDWD